MRLSVAVVSMVLAVAPAAARAAEKYLIEFGWDEPTTAFMKSHVAEMEQTPFDGTVFHVEATNPDGSTANFMSECWGKRAFGEEQFNAAEADLRATKFKKFTQNFLRINVLPGDLDWFDDYSAVIGNVRQAARVASATNCAGVLFDIEAYNAEIWRYAKQKRAKEHTWAEYCKKVEGRGRDVMRAFQDGWRAGGSKRRLVIFQTFGYSLPYMQAEGRRDRLEPHGYGLLAPFMDGMYAAADPGTTIVDGYESAYAFKTDKEFTDARALVYDKLPAFVADRDAYLKHTSLGFGLWMDEDWRKHGWDEHDPSKNFFKPAEFETSLRLALKHADRYVWVYTEKPRWWSAAGHPTGMSRGYVDAVGRAKSSAANATTAP